MKRVVWIISEGSPGHVSQSEGLVAALAQMTSLELHVVQTRPKFGGFMRKGVMLWMGRCGRPLPSGFLKRWLGCEVPSSTPNLIVTSGGKAVFAARSLAVKFGAPLVFLGERNPYPSRWFHTVFTPSPFEADVYDVPVEMVPTGITPAKVEAAANAWKERPQGRLWTMLIGGASASHDYSNEDWRLLGGKMNELAEKHGIRWLVSTSRRTGAGIEAVLRRSIAPQHIARAVWWAENPEKLMAPFLGSATWTFVTQDSVTMVTEAIASGRPVVVTMPAKTTFKETSFLPGYFKRLEQAARIVRVPIDKLASFQPGAARIQPRTQPVNAELAANLLARLHWSKGR
ncbi:MAG: ELM1/GtrOC1 family putative glycosyltransferase [Verrucomicrobiota bacterium]